MPGLTLDRARSRRNPYALRIAAEGISIPVGRGRPRKGTETGPTVPRSVRFPARVWRHLEKRARAEGIPPHAALRAAVVAWINQGTDRPRGQGVGGKILHTDRPVRSSEGVERIRVRRNMASLPLPPG